MSAQPAPFERPVTSPAWVTLAVRSELWGGIALVTIWLAVLFVGVFGGDIVTTSAGGDGSSVPVVVVVAVVALLATISVGRWAFGPGRRGSSRRC